MDTHVARQRLEELSSELDRSIATLEAENALPKSSIGREIDTSDPGSALSDAEREGAVIEVMRQQRNRVQDALARVEAGSYGNCVNCGAALPDERLEARPEAARCVTCQARAENGR